MAQETLPQTRWQEIEKIWKDNRWLYIVAGILIGIVSVPAIEQIRGDLNNLIGNLVPETIGIIFTVLILNRAADNRAKEELKQRLLAELKSRSVAPAVNALERLRHEGLIKDDELAGKDLQGANWDGAYIGNMSFENTNLEFANFKNVTNHDGNNHQKVNFKDTKLMGINLEMAGLGNVNFVGVNFQGANFKSVVLSDCSLQKADLFNVSLEKSILVRVNFEDATLLGANFNQANLYEVHFEGADLSLATFENAKIANCHLEGACLVMAKIENINWVFDENSITILPDGTQWTPDEDLERFTNPHHEEFEATYEKINAIRADLGYDPI